MQWFACVTCMIILCSARPPAHGQRSLFRDVMESVRTRSRPPADEFNTNEENYLSPNYEGLGYGSGPRVEPADAELLPRRNDRIEMPTLAHRLPKSIQSNGSAGGVDGRREDIVVYVNTPSEPADTRSTTPRPKKEKDKDPKPNSKLNSYKNKEDPIEPPTEGSVDNSRPFTNKMEGLSQIGNREYQTVIKPTVIVNFRGSVSHRDSDIRLEKRNNERRKGDRLTDPDSARNIFNISQEIKLERPNGVEDGGEARQKRNEIKQNFKLASEKMKQAGDGGTMCETCSWTLENSDRSDHGDVLRIVVTV